MCRGFGWVGGWMKTERRMGGWVGWVGGWEEVRTRGARKKQGRLGERRDGVA